MTTPSSPAVLALEWKRRHAAEHQESGLSRAKRSDKARSGRYKDSVPYRALEVHTGAHDGQRLSSIVEWLRRIYRWIVVQC